jgi:ABC-2 type transport system ATP-binding protein
MLAPVLELENLTRRFGQIAALDHVSFSVAPGSLVGFVGPNGAGKTTAMRIVLGVLEPDAGEVHWRGKPVDRHIRRRFGYMPEERGLYPKMRVLDQVAYLARLHGLPAEDARAAARAEIEALGVAERATDRLEKLSLGNQQRVQLAAALVHRPEVLVLDEPFSGLDPVGVDTLSGVLRSRAEEGVPVLFSSHQLDLVERLCESVVLIDHGHVLAAGAIADLKARSARRLVRIEVVGAVEGWLEAIPGVTLVEPLPGGGVVEPGPEVSDGDLLDRARAAGEVRHFSLVQPSLAELFRAAVER